MLTLKQKIRDTYLLDPIEKIDVLIVLDTYSEVQKKVLEQTIDEYDEKYHKNTRTMKQNVILTLNKVEMKEKLSNKKERLDALVKIRNGLNQLVPDGALSKNPSP